jgi:O-antigen/teichoic acid export membrane protein
MLNQDTWDEANRFSSILMTRLGATSIFVGILCTLLIPSFAFIGAASAFVSLTAAGLLIFRTEKRLKLLFDDKGNRG